MDVVICSMCVCVCVFCCDMHKLSMSPFLKDAVVLKFYQEAKSWFDALKHCKDEHLSLVQITNSMMQFEVKSLLQGEVSSIQAGVWIGLERSMFGKDPIPWKWISGTEVGQTDQWNSSFPVDRFNNHCGKIIQVNETDFGWLDAWCHDELPFICQGELLFCLSQ